MPILFINVDAEDITRSSVRAVNVLTPVPMAQQVLGDNRAYTLYFVTKAGVYASWSGDEDYTIKAAIGPSGKNATSGTFTISGDGTILSGTTDPIAFDAAPDAVIAALTHPTSGLVIVSTSGLLTAADVSITGNASDYVINFIGALAGVAIGALSADSEQLSPPSSSVVSVVRAGGSGMNARQSLRLRQLPYCFQDAWTPIANGWTASISTNTESLAEFLDNATGAELPFEIEVTDASGNPTTYLQAILPILNEVIDGQALVPVPLPDYYTATQTDALLASNATASDAYTDAAIAAIPAAAFQSLTTTGNSGSATLTAGVLNIPTPTAAGLGAARLSGGNTFTGDQLFNDSIGNQESWNISAVGDFNTVGIVTAASFSGSGSSLTGITAQQVGANSTQESVSNASGNTTVTIPAGSKRHAVYATVTGSAVTRIFIIPTTNATDSATIEFFLTLPAVASIVLEFRRDTAGGALIESLSPDASGRSGEVRIAYKTNAWVTNGGQYPTSAL